MKDTRTTIKLNSTMQKIVDRIIETDALADGATAATEVALREWWQNHQEEDEMHPLEKLARRKNLFIVSDAHSNPSNNKEYGFETLRDAKAHVRERKWVQWIYCPNGDAYRWSGYKWE